MPVCVRRAKGYGGQITGRKATIKKKMHNNEENSSAGTLMWRGASSLRSFRAEAFSTRALAYLMAIIAAELVTALGNTASGMIMHSIILGSLLLNGALASHSSHQKLYVAIALAPLIRIVSLAMPVEQFSEINRLLIISVPLMVGTFTAIRILDLQSSDVNLRINKLPIQLLVPLTGLVFGVVEYYILKPDPLINPLTWQTVLGPALVLIVAVGFVEELIFRGVMQNCCTAILGKWGWIYVAMLFAVLHIGYKSLPELAYILGVGLFFGWVVNKTGSLLGVTLSHGITNIMLFIVIPHLA